MTERQSHCRICGDRLSFLGTNLQVEWKKAGADDKGLVCDSCLPFAKLEIMREEMNKKDGD